MAFIFGTVTGFGLGIVCHMAYTLYHSEGWRRFGTDVMAQIHIIKNHLGIK